jgi:PAS domain S-box-containing protein
MMDPLARETQFGEFFSDSNWHHTSIHDRRENRQREEPLFRPGPGEVRELWKTVSWAFDLYDHACYADFSLDAEGIIRCANRQTEKLLGYERNDFFGKPLHFLCPDTPQGREQTARLVRLCMQGSCIEGEELQLRKADGEPVWVWVAAKPIPKEGGGIQEIRLAVADISSRKAAEADAQTARTLTALGTLSGGIAHDFNNILAICQGNIDLARMNPLSSPGEINARLDGAEKACQQAAALARRLLTFSGGGGPMTSPVSLETILKDLLETATPEPAGVDIKIHAPAGLPPIEADESQIKQVFGELLANAREAARGGETVIRISATERRISEGEEPGLTPGRYVEILFADSGAGISSENLPRIFDPYFTTKPLGSEKGRGLGLSACWSIIRQHGGAIRAASTEGASTIVTIHLPVATLGDVPPREGRLS